MLKGGNPSERNFVSPPDESDSHPPEQLGEQPGSPAQHTTTPKEEKKRRSGYDLEPILEKLQRPRGYQGCRVRPHPDPKMERYLAEMYLPSRLSEAKRWKPLFDEHEKLRTFATPEEAEQALLQARGEPFTDSRPLFAQLEIRYTPEKQRYHNYIARAEQFEPGSLEQMIEDSSTQLVSAMRALRQCRHQRETHTLYEIILGHSKFLFYLAHYAHDEAKRAQWMKIEK